MTTPPPAAGRWVQVPQPSGGVRSDWVPLEQPASPDGRPGLWHVVADPAEARWEWFPTAPDLQPVPDGEWVAVLRVDGTARRDWVPAAQPPSPDGSNGRWHVVGTADGGTRWEWHPAQVSLEPSATVTPFVSEAAPPGRRRIPAPLAAVVAVAVVAVVLTLRESSDGEKLEAVAGASPAAGAPPAAGASSAADQKAIVKATRSWVVATQPGRVCRELSTPKLIDEVFGTQKQCLPAVREHAGQSDPPTGARVEMIQVNGDHATAVVTDLGGDSDGAQGPITLRRDGGRWRVDDLSVEYLRAQFRQGFGPNLRPDPQEPTFVDDPAVGRCLIAAMDAKDDQEFRRLYYEGIRTTEAEAAQTELFDLLIECGLAPGPDGISPLRADFERGVVEGMGGPSTLTDCAVKSSRERISDDDLRAIAASGEEEGPPPAVIARLTSIGDECISRAT